MTDDYEAALAEYDRRWAFHMDALEYGLRQVQVTDELGGVLAILAESVKMLQFDIRRIGASLSTEREMQPEQETPVSQPNYRHIGWLKHNGCGEIIFKQIGHPNNDAELPSKGWRRAYYDADEDRALSAAKTGD